MPTFCIQLRRISFLCLPMLLTLGTGLSAAEVGEGEKTDTEASASIDTTKAATAKASKTADKASASSSNSSAPAHKALLKDTKKIDGLIPLYRKDSKLYGELSASHYNKDYIVLISIARGIGQGVLMPGMPWRSGEDWVWQFRKVDGRVQVVRRNLRFRAKSGTPQADAVKRAYSDSVLFSLPIKTKGPNGGDLIDLSTIFMSDLPQVGRALGGFAFSPTKSTWSSVKGFKDNIEMQVAATYTSAGNRSLDAVPDTRGVTVNIHYSFSRLPKTGYQPRMADTRVGYFVTAIMDYSKPTVNDRFVRYVNRWDLRKADPDAEMSPPKKPIVFWIEKTVPFKYRKPIREGILEWNKAFEKAGFVNAIEVRQMPDDATWDPEDINYNTIRWITASLGMAYGPSRVNPMTGEILDADILIDADYMSYSEEMYESLNPQGAEATFGEPRTSDKLQAARGKFSQAKCPTCPQGCQLYHGMSQNFNLGRSALAKAGPKELEKFIMQGLKEVMMHEVGHTLGLRHNFKGSTMLTLEELNNPEITRKRGMTASVMDYLPVNLVPKDQKQGDYFSTTIGAYDYWAVEYGYKSLGGSTKGDLTKLQEIASRSGEPDLTFATDEDTRGIDPDPMTNRHDNSKDTLAFARQRAKLVSEQLPGLVERVSKDGEDYSQVRRSLGILLSAHGRSMATAARMIGGVHISRNHRGDAGAKPPHVIVPAEKQREALTLMEEQVFSDQPFQLSPELYSHLSVPRWYHWGSSLSRRADYPAHQVIGMWQARVLSHLLSPVTLERMHDSELKISAEEDAFTTAELIQRLSRSIFSEVAELKPGEYTNRKPAISSIRRNLQRKYLKRLSALALGTTMAPEDCQTIAFSDLSALEARIQSLLKSDVKLDDYSRAHLEETASRIAKVRDARMVSIKP